MILLKLFFEIDRWICLDDDKLFVVFLICCCVYEFVCFIIGVLFVNNKFN